MGEPSISSNLGANHNPTINKSSGGNSEESTEDVLITAISNRFSQDTPLDHFDGRCAKTKAVCVHPFSQRVRWLNQALSEMGASSQVDESRTATW
jgi:hypothetical protein